MNTCSERAEDTRKRGSWPLLKEVGMLLDSQELDKAAQACAVQPKQLHSFYLSEMKLCCVGVPLFVLPIQCLL